MKNPANTMWPLRFTYQGAVVHIPHKGSPLVTWSASVMSVNIIPMHLRIEIEKQIREAEKIAALAAERAAQGEIRQDSTPRHIHITYSKLLYCNRCRWDCSQRKNPHFKIFILFSLT